MLTASFKDFRLLVGCLAHRALGLIGKCILWGAQAEEKFVHSQLSRR